MKCKNSSTFLRHLFVCVLVLGLNPLGAFAAEYFVSTTGNDSNPGTIGNPFRTLEKAASVMTSGDTMYIREGTYQRTAWDLNVPSGGGTWAAATTIKAYNNEKVVITPQNSSPGLGAGGTDIIRLPTGRSYIIFDGLILDGLGNGTTSGGSMGFRFSRNATKPNPSHHIRLINMEIRYTWDSNIYTGDSVNNEYINLNLHHASNNVDNTGPYAIYIPSGDNLMQGCDIHHQDGYGIHNYSGHSFKPNNNRFIGNYVHDNGKSGIRIASGVGVRVINNVVYNNGTGADDGYTGYNRWGIHLNSGDDHTVVYNNTSYGHPEGEVLIGPSSWNAFVRNNVLFALGAGYGVHIHSGGAGHVVTNNLVYHANESRRILSQGSATISDNIHSDPLFVDKTSPDLHLQLGSPAIGKGVVLDEVKFDFDQVQRRQPYDIGAYAFLGSLLGAPKNLIVISEK